jgi:glycosyltransferase involved in cell wall biosynthesis/4-amino-4-deoxy-L-arabinose transferase-like glycosyltransferase
MSAVTHGDSRSPFPPCNQIAWWWLVALLLVAFALRLAVFSMVVTEVTRFKQNDSSSYNLLAQNLVSYGSFGRFDRESNWQPETNRMPGYPAFLALFYATLGATLAVPLVVQNLLGVLNVALSYRLGKLWGNGCVGLVLAGIVAFELGSILYGSQLMTETLFNFLFLLGVVLWSLMLTRGRWWYGVLAGVVLALGSLVRAPIFYFTIVLTLLSLVLLRKSVIARLLYTAGMLAAFALVLTPWFVRNDQLLGVAQISTNQNIVMHDTAVRYYAFQSGELYRDAAAKIDAEIEAAFGNQIWNNPAAMASAYRQRFLTDVSANVPLYAFYHLRGSLLFLVIPTTGAVARALNLIDRGGTGLLVNLMSRSPTESWQAFQLFFEEADTGPLTGLVLIGSIGYEAIFLLLLNLGALAGLIYCLWRGRWRSAVLAMVAVGYFAAISGPIAYDARYRLPVIPFLGLMTAVAVVAVVQRRPRRFSQERPVPTLQIITRLIVGGAQETVMLVADLIDKEQWRVDVISGPQTGPEGSLIEEVRRRDIPLTLQPSLVREISPLKDVLAFWQLFRAIRREKYAIVHTNSSKAGILGRWAAWLAGTPVIVHTVHGWGHHERQHPLVRFIYIWVEKLTLPITARLVVVSPKNIDKGLADGIGKAEDYVVIRSGIELDRFGHPLTPPAESRAAWGIPADVPVVGTVTRLSPQKAPLDFVQAAAIVARQRPDTWFVMVGDGPLRPQVEAKAAELGIADRLVLTGLRRDVPELVAMFDIFVLSSLWEGLPRVLPQAMATGLPIVATAIDGNAEAVQDGENGLLVPPGDVDQLARAVLKLLNDPELAAQMGQVGLARADEYGARKMTDELARLYQTLLTANQ